MSNPLNSVPAVELEAGALGAIVENTDTRKKIYTVWVIIGLVLSGVTAALIGGASLTALAVAAGLAWPMVAGLAILGGAAAAYGALSPQVTMLARANTPSPLPLAEVVYEPEA